MMYQVQVSNVLQSFDCGGIVDGNFGAILIVEAAAVGTAPNFQLPGQVLDHAAVLHDVVGVKAGVSSILAVGIQSQLLGNFHELVPSPGILSVGRRIGQASSVEHILVVVQHQGVVGGGVSYGSTVVGVSKRWPEAWPRLRRTFR